VIWQNPALVGFETGFRKTRVFKKTNPLGFFGFGLYWVFKDQGPSMSWVFLVLGFIGFSDFLFD